MSKLTTERANQVLHEVMPGFVVDLGVEVVKLEENRATLRMPISEAACRVGGGISGQAIAGLADTAMCFALWADEQGQRPVATVDLHVTYMRAVSNEGLLAHAEVVRSGRTLSFAKVEIIAEQSGKVAGTAIGTFAWPA